MKSKVGDIKSVYGDSDNTYVDMIIEVYGHIPDEYKKNNADIMMDCYYNYKKVNPHLKNQDEGSGTIIVLYELTVELLMDMLGDSEMPALLTSFT